MKHIIGLTFIACGIGIIIYVLYANANIQRESPTFSSFSLVRGAWERYKTNFITPEGQVLDHTQNITTSEGQSYAMLRAVWMDDLQTFDKVWSWTKNNLRGSVQPLFSWKYGRLENDQYGIIDPNSASDASVDIALALILARHKFNSLEYLDEAKKILPALWDKEVGEYNNSYYLVAGEWARGKDYLVLNPSYFAPYAFRVFAEVDPDRPWQKLVDSTYTVLNDWSAQTDNFQLPPDWMKLNRNNGKLSTATDLNLSCDYSYDALRVPYRISLDAMWFEEERALNYLREIGSKLEELFNQEQKLIDKYDVTGVPLTANEAPAMYATALSAWYFTNRPLADRIYEEKIKGLYSNDTRSFRDDIAYYEQNILWFSTAQHEGYLLNYASE
jgi:endoglucanase